MHAELFLELVGSLFSDRDLVKHLSGGDPVIGEGGIQKVFQFTDTVDHFRHMVLYRLNR